MANELQIKIGIDYANGDLKDTVKSEPLAVTQTEQCMYAPVVIVGTSEEDLPVGDILTNGYVYLQNLDPTNFVKYGPKSAGAMVAFGRLKPREKAVVRLEPGVTLRWVADTGPVKVLVKHYAA